VNILEVQFKTNSVAKVKDFYVNTLNLPLLDDTNDSFTLLAGLSKLVFSQTDSKMESFYHFAFNISENKFAEAKEWLLERLPLLKENDNEEFVFTAWNAHALYFLDPAGNIVEFIARHNLFSGSTGPFSVKDILCVSEIGLSVNDVPEAVDYLRSSLGIEPWKGNGETFQPVGDEHGLFIVVPGERPWFPTEKKGGMCPLAVKIQGDFDGHYVILDLPYHVDVVGTGVK
jgi:catechol-2,3-dioxygenase